MILLSKGMNYLLFIDRIFIVVLLVVSFQVHY